MIFLDVIILLLIETFTKVQRRSSISDVSTGFPSPLWSFMDRCGHEIFFPLGDIVDTRPTDNTKLQSSMQLGRMLERCCVHIATSTFSRIVDGLLMLTVN